VIPQLLQLTISGTWSNTRPASLKLFPYHTSVFAVWALAFNAIRTVIAVIDNSLMLFTVPSRF
jgi:hypothetical protein